MMEVAAAKRTDEGDPVYRALTEADLTKQVPLDDNSYPAIVSAGTFTFGHLGPSALDEVLRIAGPGATLAIGVNADHFREDGFADRFDADTTAGRITRPTFVDIAVYRGDVGEHSDSRALIAVFAKR